MESRVLQCYPSDIELKLGFDVVRRSIEGRLQTRMALELARAESPTTVPREVESRLTAVTEWQDALRSGDAPGLTGLPDLVKPLGRIGPAGSWLEPPDLLAVTASLAMTRHFARFFSERGDQFPFLSAVVEQIHVNPELEKSIGRVIDEQGNVRDNASSDLRRIRKQLRHREGALRSAADRALASARDAGYAAGDAPTIRGGRLVIPVKVEVKRRLPGSIVDTSASGRTAFLEPEDCQELGNELRLLEAQERREIVRILIDATDQVRMVAGALLHNQDLLAEQDLFRAKAHLANEMNAIVPQQGDGRTIQIRAAINPALFLLRRGAGTGSDERAVIPLEMTLTDPDVTLVISGPNAGGKSVAMKTVGLFVLMLAYGIPIPCDQESILPLFDKLFIAFGDDQSMENDLSTFSSHLASLKFIVEHADSETLVLVDEIGSGTDPAAGEAIAAVVLGKLTDNKGFSIATTHFGGLKVLANDTPGMVNGAMRFDPDQLAPTYVFELGVPGSSYALEIADRGKFPAELLKEARIYLGDERTRIDELILGLAKARSDASAMAAELSKQTQNAADAAQRHREAKEKIDRDKDAILSAAHDRAEALFQEANRAIERTIREIREAQAEKGRTKEVRGTLGDVQKRIRAARPTKKPAASAKTPKETAKPLAIGDHVVLDGGTAVGKVESIKGSAVEVAFELAVMKVDAGRLQKVTPPKKVKSNRRIDSRPIAPVQIAPRLDLRGLHIAEAIPVLEKYVDDALRTGLIRLEILHGTGTGALREAVRDHLQRMADVSSHEEAPIDEGGAGVTYVFLS